MKPRLLPLLVAILFILPISAQNKKSGNDLESYNLQRGIELYSNDEYDDALAYFKQELADNPKNGFAWIWLAIERNRLEQYGRALSAVNNGLKYIPTKDKKYTSAAYQVRSDIYLALGDTISAIKDLDTLTKLYPQDTYAYEKRGYIYFSQAKYDLSDAEFLKEAALEPGEVMPYMGLGRNEAARGNHDQAIERFSYVIKMAPDYSTAYSFRGESYLAQKKYSQGVDDIIKAVSIDNDTKANYMLYGLEEQALPVAKAKLQIMAKKDPYNPLWCYYLANMLENNRRYDEAIEAYQEAYTRDADDFFLKNIAICYAKKDEYDPALEYITRAINMDPEYYLYLYYRANILEMLGRFDDAVADMDSYIDKNPEDVDGYSTRGWLKMMKRDNDGAFDDYTTAIILAPDTPAYYVYRGKMYLQKGNAEAAKADFEQALALDNLGKTLGADSITDLDSSCAHYALYFLGRKDEAKARMDSILAYTSDPCGDCFDAACLYSLMGETNKSLDYLSKALEEGYRNFPHIQADSDLDNIRDTPRFKELMEKYSTQPQPSPKVENEAELGSITVVLPDVTEIVVPFTKEGGVTKVKCAINGLPLHFVFDTGAADVTMSMVEANFMLKNDYLTPKDIIGSARYIDANGGISEGTVINLRKVTFGGMTLDNVRASVVRNQRAPLLLGQSVLGRLGKIEIDNHAQCLSITPPTTSK